MLPLSNTNMWGVLRAVLIAAIMYCRIQITWSAQSLRIFVLRDNAVSLVTMFFPFLIVIVKGCCSRKRYYYISLLKSMFYLTYFTKSAIFGTLGIIEERTKITLAAELSCWRRQRWEKETCHIMHVCRCGVTLTQTRRIGMVLNQF